MERLRACFTEPWRRKKSGSKLHALHTLREFATVAARSRAKIWHAGWRIVGEVRNHWRVIRREAFGVRVACHRFRTC